MRQEHIDKYGIDKEIKAIIPHANIFAVQETTRGAVETCLMAREVIEEEDAVLVMDCDLEFISQGFNVLIKESFQIRRRSKWRSIGEFRF